MERIPVCACLSYAVRYLELRDVGLSDHEVGVETGAVVPCEMAMEWPDTGVIREELDDCVRWDYALVRDSSSRQDMDVASHGVGWVCDVAVPRTVALC